MDTIPATIRHIKVLILENEAKEIIAFHSIFKRDLWIEPGIFLNQNSYLVVQIK
jgi:hypothetical protein